MGKLLTPGVTKYQEILDNLMAKGRCEVACTRIDTTTIIQAVKKFKVRLTKEGKIPRDKVLKITPTEKGVHFELVIDTSINNL